MDTDYDGLECSVYRPMIGILGGTFDPVHHGHLRLALEMLEGLKLDEVRLVPARQPPHRGVPSASAEDRRAMLEAALANTPGLRLDVRELTREGPSYTVDTLTSLRRELPGPSLCLIIGMDAFRELDTWHRWEALLDLAHIGIAQRPGALRPNSGPVAALLRDRHTDDPAVLGEACCGRVIVRETPLLDISATRIRRLLAAGRNPRFLLPDAVLDVIHQRGLYLAIN